MQFKMKQEKVHELEQNFHAKVKRLSVFPIRKKKIYEDEAGEGSPILGKISKKRPEINHATGFKKKKKAKKINKIKTKPRQQQQKTVLWTLRRNRKKFRKF